MSKSRNILIHALTAVLIGTPALSAGEWSPGAEIAESRVTPLIWEWPVRKGIPLQIEIDKTRPIMYVAMKDAGLQVFKLENPAPPTLIAKVPRLLCGAMDAVALAQNGNYLYVGLGDLFAHHRSNYGLLTVDISLPQSPRVVSIWKSPQRTGGSSSILIHDGYLYLGAMSSGFAIFNLADVSCPQYITTIQPNPNFPVRNPNRVQHPNVRSLAASGQLLYVCNDAGGLRVFDISDKSAAKEIGCYLNQMLLDQQQAYNGIVLDPPFAYLTCDYAGVEVVEISDPRSIRQVAWWDPWRKDAGKNFWFGSKGHANQIEMDRNSRRLFVSAGDSELLVLDVRDPRHPRICAHYGNVKDSRGAWGVTVDKGTAYLSFIRSFIPFRSTFCGIAALDCGQTDE